MSFRMYRDALKLGLKVMWTMAWFRALIAILLVGLLAAVCVTFVLTFMLSGSLMVSMLVVIGGVIPLVVVLSVALWWGMRAGMGVFNCFTSLSDEFFRVSTQGSRMLLVCDACGVPLDWGCEHVYEVRDV